MWTCGTGAPRPPRLQQRFNDKQDWHVPTRVDPHTQHVANAPNSAVTGTGTEIRHRNDVHAIESQKRCPCY
jgi:hypothetical protein